MSDFDFDGVYVTKDADAKELVISFLEDGYGSGNVLPDPYSEFGGEIVPSTDPLFDPSTREVFMTSSITTQPADSSVLIGETHAFTVVDNRPGPLEYEWFVDGVSQGVQLTPDFIGPLVADLLNSYTKVYVIIRDTSDNSFATSDTAFAISKTAAATATRHSLVWNYDDNNFTWRDPLVEKEQKLYDIQYQAYGFSPGHQERWFQYKSGGDKENTWDAVGNLTWNETFSRGKSKQIMQIVDGDVYLAEQQVNAPGSLKRYYVTRTQIDFDDLVPEWNSNLIKQIKQFTFHLQSDQRFIGDNTNNIQFYVGWANNLMEDPNWKSAITVDLQDRKFGGDYRIDYRTSGRYLAYSFDFTDSEQLAFTGGHVDANVVAGR